MPMKHIIVDWVRALDRPGHPLIATTSGPARNHVTVHLRGSACLLDRGHPEAGVWEAVLDDLRASNEPVFLETDPATNVISQVLCPKSFRVAGVAAAPQDDRLLVEFHISHARHYVSTKNPDYQKLVTALTAAHHQGTPVLVTETLDGHEIIDVRPDSRPLAHGPVVRTAAPAGPWVTISAAATGVTPEKAQQLFTLVANQPQIPFTFPDDGCWGRAHEMCRLIIANGVQPRKVWIYGNLRVATRNSPDCSVSWGWHVAPTLLINSGGSSQVDVIDPSMFSTPVPQVTWAGAQNDPHASLNDSDAAAFHRSSSGYITYDPNYVETQQVLATYRRELALRTARFGPPPYRNCP